MKLDEENVLLIIILFIFAGAFVLALNFNSIAKVMPLAITIPGTVLAAVQLGITLYRKRKAPVEGAGTESRKKIFIVWSWIVGFVILSAVVGFLVAVPVFLVSFFKFFAGRTWLKSAVIGGIITAAIHLLFNVGLGVGL